MKKKLDKEKYLIFVSAIFLGYSILYKSFKNLITYDEAQTFLNYVYTDNFINFGIGNNHPINTIFMLLMSKISFELIYLRVPNILFGFFYIYTSYKISKNENNPFFVFVILTFNPFLIEFFTLARGYGISASLILQGIYLYFYTSYKNKYFYSCLMFLISSFNLYYTAIISVVFSVMYFKKEVKVNYRMAIFSQVLIFSGTLPVIYLMNNVTNLDKSLIGLKNISLNNFIINFFGFSDIVNPELPFLGLLFFTLVFLNLKKEQILNKNNKFFLISLGLLFLIPFLLNKPIPTGRVLIPFLPLLLMFIIKNIKYSFKLNFLIIAIILFNFFSTLNLYNNFIWDNSGASLEKYLKVSKDSFGDCKYTYHSTFFRYELPSEYYQIVYGTKEKLKCS